MVPSIVGRFQRWMVVGALFWAAYLAHGRFPHPASPWLFWLGVGVTVLMGTIAALGPFEETPWKVAIRGVVSGGCLLILAPVDEWVWIMSALAGTWALDELTLRPGPEVTGAEPAGAGARRAALAAMIVAVAATSTVYGWLVRSRLDQTAALFVGLPTLLALVIVYLGRPRTLTGAILKAVSLGLAVAAIAWSEGFICILMASPLFLGIGALVGAAVERSRRARSERAGTWTACLLILTLGPMSLEGAFPRLSFPRQESVRVVREVHLSAPEVREQVARKLIFDRPLPTFLRLGFPRPVASRGSGLRPGDGREVVFAGGDGLRLEVAESREGYVRFHVVSDSTMVAHWLAWQESEVRWQPLPGGRSRVAWTLRYRRELDPAWYFGPWERYAVRLAGETLVDAAFGHPARHPR